MHMVKYCFNQANALATVAITYYDRDHYVGILRGWCICFVNS